MVYFRGWAPPMGVKSRAIALLSAVVLGLSLVACTGPTTVEPQAQNGPYRVEVRMDPPTLNPPQLSSLTFSVVDAASGKAVEDFDQVSDALLHNIVISQDLSFFRHSFAKKLVVGDASVLTYFPKTGKYYTYTLYKPAKAELQTFMTAVTTGSASTAEPQLKDDSDTAKVAGAMRLQLLKAPGAIKAGQPVQLVFHVSERGNAVSGLWPYFGAPGHLWLVDEHGGNFAHETGASSSRQLLQPATPGAASGSGTGSGALASETTTSNSSYAAATPTLTGQSTAGQAPAPSVSTAVPGSQEGTVGGVEPAPTYMPQVGGQLTALAATTTPLVLAPVQQTAQASILETPAVQPSVGYGPDVAFTHVFPEPGLYKMWMEVLYRGQVTTVDYVVNVTK